MREMTARMAGWGTKRWVLMGIVVSGVSGTLFAGIGAGAATSTWKVPAGVAAGLLGTAAASWMMLHTYHHLQVRRETEEVRALVNVRPLTGSLPLDLGDWAADSLFADGLMRCLVRRRPNRIVECGSGWTTVLMGRCLRELGNGQVVALEHDEYYARRTRSLLRIAGCDDRAEVITAPLEMHHLDGVEWPWYSLQELKESEGAIELLVVDGPPGSVADAARYPAVPLLRDRFAEEFTILLDDGFRSDEADIASAWGRMLGIEPELEPRGRGLWLLETRPGGDDVARGDGETYT